MRSVRLRLALSSSVLVFGLAALVLGGVNLVVSRSLAGEPISRELRFTTITETAFGPRVEELRGRLVDLERLVNERTLADLRRFSIYLLGALFPTSVLIGWLVAGRMLRPIGAVTQVAQEIQATDLSRRIRLAGPDDELRRLADTFDAMLDRLQLGVEEQRAFIEDTTHELRNPLAVMATSLDVALSDPEGDPATLRRSAEVVRRTLDRTSRTVDELIRFARQDPAGSHQEPVALEAVLSAVLDEFALAARERDLSLQVVGSDPVTAVVDRDALRSAYGNLVGNAVRLAPEGSTVWCGSGRRDGWAWMAVRDEGPGLDPPLHAAIFERAWGEPDRHDRARRRSGLGLAIVRQVAAAHRGLVTVSSRPGVGSSFCVWLPLSAEADPADISADGIHPIADPDGFALPG